MTGNSKGLSMMETILAMLMVGISAMTLIDLYRQMNQWQTSSNAQMQLQLFARDLALVIRDSRSWTRTINATVNTNMACLADPAVECTEPAAQTFALFDATGALIYDSTNPYSGISLNGRPCSTFSQSGNADCPFRYELQWRPLCTTPCLKPQLEISARLTYAPADKKLVINEQKYQFPVIGRTAQ